MLTLLKTGLDFLLSGGSVIGNANIILKPMSSSWSASYSSSPSNSNHTFLVSGGEPIGYPVAFTTDYFDSSGSGSTSSGNRQRLLLAGGIDTTAPSAAIVTTNATTTRKWLVHDPTAAGGAGVDIGYVDLGSIPSATIALGTITFSLADLVFGSMEVNNGISYPLSNSIKALYSGDINNLTDSVELVIVKKTDDSDFTDSDLIDPTDGLTVANMTASALVTVVDSAVALDPATVSTSQASLICPDQGIVLSGVSETKCTVLLNFKDADKSLLKIVAMNIALEGYIVLNFTDSQDDFVLL